MSKYRINQRTVMVAGVLLVLLMLWMALAATEHSGIARELGGPPPPGSRLIWGLKLPPDVRTRQAQTAARIAQSSGHPHADRTSDYMLGTIAVAIILPRCVGSSCTESWTTAEITQVKSEVQSALTWWEQKSAEVNNGVPLVRFQIVPGHPITVSTSVEPINIPGGNSEALCGDEGAWIDEVMANLGYNHYTDTVTMKNTYLNEVFDYNHHLRQVYGTDWAFVAFVADASNDAIHDPVDGDQGRGLFRFTTCGGTVDPFGVSGYGWFTGPHMVMNNVNDGWGSQFMDGVAAMEIGHIFGAPDEWYAPGGCMPPGQGPSCSYPWGYLSVANGNCNYSNDPNIQTCMLNDNHSIMRAPEETAWGSGIISSTVNYYTRGQIGWRDSDSDGWADPIDTTPVITLTAYSPDPTSDRSPTYTGVAQDIPWHTTQSGYVDVTINDVSVQYRVNGGSWRPAAPADGAFDSPYEAFTFTPLFCQNGTYLIEVQAVNSVGHTSGLASDTLTVSSTEVCQTTYLPLALKGYGGTYGAGPLPPATAPPGVYPPPGSSPAPVAPAGREATATPGAYPPPVSTVEQ